MKNYVQDGKVIDYVHTGSGTIASGGVVALVSGIGVAVKAFAAGNVTPQSGALAVEGVFSLAKETGQTWAIGERLYWDAGNSRLTKTAGSNLLAGYAAKAAASGDTSGRIKLVELADSEAGNLSQAAAVSDLNQDISAIYVEAEVQAISDKVDELLASLRAAGLLAT